MTRTQAPLSHVEGDGATADVSAAPSNGIRPVIGYEYQDRTRQQPNTGRVRDLRLGSGLDRALSGVPPAALKGFALERKPLFHVENKRRNG